MGVLPVPPAVIFPTLMTGTVDSMNGGATSIKSPIPKFHGPGIGRLPRSAAGRATGRCNTALAATNQLVELCWIGKGEHAQQVYSPYIDCDARGLPSQERTISSSTDQRFFLAARFRSSIIRQRLGSLDASPVSAWLAT